MVIENRTCGNCGGTGRIMIWKVLSTDSTMNTGAMKGETATCTSCNGAGYIEYAVFTVKEAKAILKHCGLSTES